MSKSEYRVRLDADNIEIEEEKWQVIDSKLNIKPNLQIITVTEILLEWAQNECNPYNYSDSRLSM